MKRFIAFVIFAACIFPVIGEADDIVQKGEVLNMQRVAEIAIMRHPAVSAAKNTASAAESIIGQSLANYYPQITWTSGYSRISPIAVTTVSSAGILTSVGSSVTTGAFDQWTHSASLTQNIYDFGRTSNQVKVSRLNFDSSRSDLENVVEQVVQSVKQAYFALLQAKRNRDVSADTVKQFEQHLEQAKGFFEVGTKPRFDVIKAEVDLSNAKLNLIKAENAVKIAVVNLNNAMGVPDVQEYTIEDNLSFRKYEITMDNALTRAFENRPDLLSVVAKKQSAETSINVARANYYPFLTGNAAYDWAGSRIDGLDHGWNVGATLTFPVFSGFLTKYQVEQARSNLNVLKANEESIRQTIILDVQQAYLNLKQAEESIPTAELGVKQAQENMDISNGRYAAGVGNPIEVTDAEVSLVNAKTSYIQALYDYKVAQANLEKAMGMR